MTKKYIDCLRLLWEILTSILIAIAGICLMAGCYSIFRSDEGFSRAAVAAAFAPIAIPVYLCLGAVIGGWMLHLAFPAERKARPKRQSAMVLNRMRIDRDLNLCGPTLKKDISTQRKLRLLHKLITISLTIIGGSVFFCFALQPDAFHATQINGSVIQAMKILLPCMGIPFVYGIFTAYFCKNSMEKEISLLKMVPKATNGAEAVSPTPKFNSIFAVRLVLTCAAVALLVYGLATGGIADVLTKAINICTECVGLG